MPRKKVPSNKIPGVDYEVGFKAPPVHSRFKPGQSGNPKGTHDSVRGRLTRLSRQDVEDVSNVIMQGSVDELKAIAKDPGSSAIKVMVAALVVRVIQRGDTHAFQTLMDRLVGPVKQEMKFSGNAVVAPQIVISLPANGREAPLPATIIEVEQKPDGTT